MSREVYQELIELTSKATLLGSCSHVLGWDEQTYMPVGGAEHRANQLGLLAGMGHEMHTSSRIGELLNQLEENSSFQSGSAEDVNVREIRRGYDRATKLPRRLVEELSRAATLGHHAWVEARKANDFRQFQSHLETMITLKREEAAAIGYEDGVPYDALLDDYEPHARTGVVQQAFASLRKELSQLLAEIMDSGIEADVNILTRHYPQANQQQVGLQAAQAIGFNFEEGRLDVTAHPFCSGFGPGDCRLTTRYNEHHFPGAFFGTLHEAGHGIYEQGLNREAYGTPMGESCSLGIHESQSRMWENFVGRSRSFWNHFWKPVQHSFPEALGSTNQEEFYRAINDVRPSFIRVEADEVTYNLHIMLRFELEQKMIASELDAKDIPDAWNENFTNDFGITPEKRCYGLFAGCSLECWFDGIFSYLRTGEHVRCSLLQCRSKGAGRFEQHVLERRISTVERMAESKYPPERNGVPSDRTCQSGDWGITLA